MYKFQLDDGSEARIYFSHKGGKPAILKPKCAGPGYDVVKPAVPPKMTICSIVSGDDLLGQGMARPVRQVIEPIASDISPGAVQKIFRKRLIRTAYTDAGQMFAILKGDNFSRKRGRVESMKKALDETFLSATERTAAWDALNGVVPLVEAAGDTGE